MKAISKFFKSIKWWEYAYMALIYCVIITIGIIFKSSVIIIFNSLLGITTCFFSSKGSFLVSIVGIIQLFLYSILCFYNKYYGEIIICAVIEVPTYLITLYSWLKNRNQGSSIIKINNNPSLWEWVTILLISAFLYVGMYFMLRAFGTANLILSTLSVCLYTVAGYLMIKRCEYNFAVFILSYFVNFGLWLSVVLNEGDLSYIPTVCNYVFYSILGFVGIFNWAKLKKLQNLRKEKNDARMRLNENQNNQIGE